MWILLSQSFIKFVLLISLMAESIVYRRMIIIMATCKIVGAPSVVFCLVLL